MSADCQTHLERTKNQLISPKYAVGCCVTIQFEVKNTTSPDALSLH